MSISFALKPRREDTQYKIFLYAQYTIFAFVTEVLGVVGREKTPMVILRACAQALVWWFMLYIAMKARERIANLPDSELSHFLTNGMMKGGLLIGLGQLIFLTFASIQCKANAAVANKDWRECNRTLASQTGLAALVTMFVVVKVLSGIVPKKILDKHIVSLKKVVTMDLNLNESVQCVGLSIAGFCALYLLGHYGAEGDFYNEVEKWTIWSVIFSGCSCLLGTSVWKLFVMMSEMKQRRMEGEEEEEEEEENNENEPALTEASQFWFVGGIVATTLHSMNDIATAITLDEYYETISTITLPFVLLAYGGSFFCQPRRRSPRYMNVLRLHFGSFCWVGELAMLIFRLRRGENATAISHFVRVGVWTYLFHRGLKQRALVGRLPDEDLSYFLVNALFKGSLQTLFSILFLSFRTTKCILEEGDIYSEDCTTTSYCSMFLSAYLILWWFTKMLAMSVRREWRNEVNLSIEKIARMDMSFRRVIECFLTFVTGVCGILLFSMMSSDRKDRHAVYGAGVTGLVAVVLITLSENLTVRKALKQKQKQKYNVEKKIGSEIPVSECSWVFSITCFLLTSIYTVLCFIFGYTLNNTYWLLACLVLPIVAMTYTMAFVLKPKRRDWKYMSFLTFHFFTFAIVSEFSTAVGDFRLQTPENGLLWHAWFSVLRIPVWLIAFRLTLKLREQAAQLAEKELSEFLCQSVLVKGTVAMGPMLFFSFEALSCFVSQDSFTNGQCNNTSKAAVYLSAYIAITTMLSMARKSLSERIQKKTAWKLDEIATLDLPWWQQLQGGLLLVTTMSSLYLLGVLGVESEEHTYISVVGGLGLMALLVATGIGIVVLLRTKEGGGGEEGDMEMEGREERGGRAFTTSEMLEDGGFFVGALV
ncbi:hypothetical protein TL16_g06338 [Triparma laevis f. inornata]|uniref:Uncharacterized protein n=1 Tax=Triparma laevis f. inornata TaxID=1714386 RepID=A0A9W7ALP0_9STRA|nr:hypothetical protein TL16_g06338 [Triparma laevis f. inornata]